MTYQQTFDSLLSHPLPVDMACLCGTIKAVLVITGLLVLLKLYVKLRTKWCRSKVSLLGKTTIVTGANVGIGYETALDFAMRGARVILACRDEGRATEARDKIVRLTTNKNVVVKLVDFSSLKSVRSFAKDVVASEERLDILVNNAGLGGVEDKLTEDSFQYLFQANYLGPVLLTILLTDLLKKTVPSRVINVSSIMAAYAKLDLDNLNKHPGSYLAYNNSKLCNVLFTQYFAKLVDKYNITVYSLHPGVVNTEILRRFQGFVKVLVDIVKGIFFKTSEEGAQTTLYTALEQGIESYSGSHFEECHRIEPYSTAKDPDLAERLWKKSVEMLKCEEEVKVIFAKIVNY